MTSLKAKAALDLKPSQLELNANGNRNSNSYSNRNSNRNSTPLLQGSSIYYRDGRVRMATVARVTCVVLISVLHLVSIILLTLSLALGSGGVETAAAISVDWLPLIAMAIFLLHRVRSPQREYIRPRSICCFCAISLFSGVNLVLFIVRYTTDDQGLVRDFESFANPRAAAVAILAIAAVATFLGLVGLYVSYAGCYVETRPRRPKPFISRPMLDWHPHPVDTPPHSLYASHSLELGHVQGKYIPGLIPPWKGGVDSERAATPAPWQRVSSYGQPQGPRSQRSFGSMSQWSRSSEHHGNGHGHYGPEQWSRSVRVPPPKRVWSGISLNGRI